MSILIGSSNNSPSYAYLTSDEKNTILDSIQNKIETVSKVKVKRIQKDNEEILWVRDIFVIIDNVCLICNLTKLDTLSKDRSNEFHEIVKYILKYTTYKLHYLPKGISLEGGDIIQNNNDIFIGMNKRTTKKAYQYLKRIFPTKNFIPVLHKDLHLDCVLTILKNNTILYSKKRILNSDAENFLINLKLYKTINIDSDNTNDSLLTNLIIIGNNIIHSSRVLKTKTFDIIEELGYNIHTVDIKDLWKEGGGIRCLTQWIDYPTEQLIK